MPGVDNLIVESRAALLDAIAALEAHKDSVILVGAQAIYLRTGRATFALAEVTKDSDLAIDPRTLGEDPRLEEAMRRAGFILNPVSQQPGAWMSPIGIPVDPMVPEQLSGAGSRRGVRIPPHDRQSARRTAGLEAAIIDQEVTERALIYLRNLFASPEALGSTMAGRAEEGVGQPATVAASTSILAQDLLSALA